MFILRTMGSELDLPGMRTRKRHTVALFRVRRSYVATSMSTTLPGVVEVLIPLILQSFSTRMWQSSKTDLIALSLVNRKFREWALPLLFDNIAVQYCPAGKPPRTLTHRAVTAGRPRTRRTLADFHQFLGEVPHIACHVRSLRLQSVPFAEATGYERNAARYIVPSIFLSILKLMPGLKNLHLIDVILEGNVDTVRKLIHALRLPPKKLATLQIEICGMGPDFGRAPFHCGVVASLLAAFHTIDHVLLDDLRNVSKYRESEETVVIPSTVTIHALEMSTYEIPAAKILKALRSLPTVQSITSLEFLGDDTEDMQDAFLAVLPLIGPRLKHLGLGLQALDGFSGELRQAGYGDM